MALRVALLGALAVLSANVVVAQEPAALSEQWAASVDRGAWRRLESAEVDPAILRGLMHYLSVLYDLPEPRTSPEVVFMSQEALVSHLAGVTGAATSSISESDVVALYDTRTGTVLLEDSWIGHGPVEQSVLIHELVHHMQSEAGRVYACPQAREQEAYRAQADWLARSGKDIESAFDINPMMLLVLTTCGM